MSLATVSIILVNILYSITVASHFYNHRWGLGLAFTGFIIGNIGLIVAEHS